MDDHDSASDQRIKFAISGMTCAACVRRVERAAARVEGVVNASVNLATEKASVEMRDPTPERIEAVRTAIANAGYQARLVTEPIHDPDSDLIRDFVLACLLALPILVLSMGPMMLSGGMTWMMSWMSMEQWNQTLWFFATAVQFIPGARFYRHAWSSLRTWSPDMNLLVALGTTAAYGYSTVVTWLPSLIPASARHIYFESSAVVIAFVLLGKVLERRSKSRSRDAIESLGRLQPRTARRLQPNPTHDGIALENSAVEVEIKNISQGDIVEIHAGEAIPVDGVVLEGTSYVDESVVTGEPIPCVRAVGDPVIGGTINGNGMLRVRVEATGEKTFLARIITLVADAQATKPPIQNAVDRIVARFVPAVLSIAFLTALCWLIFGGQERWTQALVHSVAVLIVACPCAMGLATPISTMVGTGRAAELGILFRSGEAFELLASVDRIAFDKTGTLTQGKPTRGQVRTIDPWTEPQLLDFAIAAASTSQHPVSKAIVATGPTRDRGLAAHHSEHVPGSGLIAELTDGKRIHLGSPGWMGRLGFLPNGSDEPWKSALESGQTVVCVAVDGTIAGWITVSDPAKPEGIKSMQQLKKQGVEPWILSGDHPAPVKQLADQLGIQHALGNLLPEQKSDQLRTWQSQGYNTAFVGDGINDAPALASANVGIALGTGTEVAIAAADVVLISGNLSGVPTALRLARAMMRNIRLNLLWAFGYNILLIPIAAGLMVPIVGWSLNPMWGALAMSLSSVFVVTNALRLTRFQNRFAK
jgi:Cu+-exporting ATPase